MDWWNGLKETLNFVVLVWLKIVFLSKDQFFMFGLFFSVEYLWWMWVSLVSVELCIMLAWLSEIMSWVEGKFQFLNKDLDFSFGPLFDTGKFSEKMGEEWWNVELSFTISLVTYIVDEM